ncbi:hypothetical protein N865_01280 [Intrasporangium oryzae NRRL B-24470]|uniref:Copper transporter n=1 Tax=Intrasporangium oryzae NRRL B-24470 TaxID=1386089 RepID=W9G0R2_9MICO|nr:copper transporter [Intrasporangium oryzae]EWS99665.1 hypothetical protein N865_01280 [Intrasporangium oryzae NRRL B-24470]
MIDFRYHLVSIISIFLALAVGIVLGAGPLQGNIGSQLSDQVSALRTEKQELNAKLATSEKRVNAADEYATAVAGRVVAGRLATHEVVGLVLPSADDGLVGALQTSVAASGAKLNAVLTVTPDWFDPALKAKREQAAKAAATALGLTSSETGDALLAQVLSRIAVAKGTAVASASRTAALKVLVDAGLIESSVEAIDPGDLALVVSSDFSGTESAVTERADAVRTLATDLAENSETTVVAGGEPLAAAGQPVSSDAVAAIREKNDTAAIVSTVDHARDGSGPAIVVLAFESQLAGRVGHYGISTGATATVPRVAP